MQRNVTKYYFSGFFCAFSLVYAISILYYQAVGLSFTEIGLLWVGTAGAAIVLELPSGIFCDFFGRKVTVGTGCALHAAGLFTIGASHDFWGVLAGTVLYGASEAFFSGADDALIYDSLKALGRESEYMKVQSRMSLVVAASMVSASVIGAHLFTVHESLPFLAAGFSNLIACLLVITMEEPHSSAQKYSVDNQLQHLKKSVLFCLTHTKLRWLIAFSSAASLPVMAFIALGDQPYMIAVGYGSADLGYIFGFAAGMSSLIAAFSDRIESWLGEARALPAIVFCPAVLFALGGMTTHWGIGLMILLGLYVVSDCGHIVINAYIHHQTSSEHRATVLSVQSLFSSVLRILLFALAGTVMDRFSVGTLLLCLAGLLMVTALPLLLLRSWSQRSRIRMLAPASTRIGALPT